MNKALVYKNEKKQKQGKAMKIEWFVIVCLSIAVIMLSLWSINNTKKVKELEYKVWGLGGDAIPHSTPYFELD
jgi:uncharacterized integral membrane protein